MRYENGPWGTGDRVVLSTRTGLLRRGTVSYARSGFVYVRWDDGEGSLVWGADLAPEDAEAQAA
jgi:hypothetical protein